MELNILNNSSFINVLNWKDILQQLSTHLHFDYNHQRIERLKFFKNAHQIEAEFDIISYFLETENIIEYTRGSLSQIPTGLNFTIPLRRIEKLSWPEVNDVNTIFIGAEFYFDFFINSPISTAPLVNFFPINIDDLKKFNKKILTPYRKLILPDNSINYLAHPELKILYNETQKLQSSIRKQIKQLLIQFSQQNILQNDQYDILDNHYVVAIKSDAYNSNLGIIRGKSQSNLTLYVEPYELIELNQKLVSLNSQLSSKLYRLLRDLTEQMLPFLPLLRQLWYILIKLDLSLAKAQYCKKANLVRPIISTTTEVTLKNFFHPLLNNPIHNSISLTSEQHGLVLSGPNTGGKTVTLKSIALSCLFLRLGIFVPAEEAKLPLFTGVYFFANDQQNIKEGLSSFAAETKNYLNLLDNLTDNNIIFIDEVFNSTSSEEASALALALIDKITTMANAKILISTHHSSFKTLIQTKKSFINGHVGIDHKTWQPTYKIHYGSPGSSMALEIFKHLANSSAHCKDLVAQAKKYLQKDQMQYEALLHNLSTQEGLLHKERKEIEQLKHELLRQKENTKHLLRLEKEGQLNNYQQKLSSILQEAEKLLTTIRQGKITSINTFHQKATSIKHNLSSQAPEINSKRVTTTTKNNLITTGLSQLKIGNDYYCSKSKNMVKLLTINSAKKNAQVRHKNFKFTCKLEELFINRDKAQEQQTKVHFSSDNNLQLEVNCLGMRLDTFQDTIHHYLAALQLEQLPYVIITHGHGDGVLKHWLRHFIKKHKYFSWIPIDGNDGQTRIELINN